MGRLLLLRRREGVKHARHCSSPCSTLRHSTPPDTPTRPTRRTRGQCQEKPRHSPTPGPTPPRHPDTSVNRYHPDTASTPPRHRSTPRHSDTAARGPTLEDPRAGRLTLEDSRWKTHVGRTLEVPRWPNTWRSVFSGVSFCRARVNPQTHTVTGNWKPSRAPWMLNTLGAASPPTSYWAARNTMFAALIIALPLLRAHEQGYPPSCATPPAPLRPNARRHSAHTVLAVRCLKMKIPRARNTKPPFPGSSLAKHGLPAAGAVPWRAYAE